MMGIFVTPVVPRWKLVWEYSEEEDLEKQDDDAQESAQVWKLKLKEPIPYQHYENIQRPIQIRKDKKHLTSWPLFE